MENMANSTGESPKYNPSTGKFITGIATKYSSEIAEELVQYGIAGKTINAFIVDKRIPSSTLHNWANTIPEFALAKEFHKAAVREYWESILRKQAEEGSTQATIYAMKAILKLWDTRKAKENQTNIQVNYDSLPEEQKLKVLQEALKQLEQKELAIETSNP